MKYAVDRIVEDIAVLENIYNGVIVEVSVKKLPKGVHEGSIVVLDNEKYILDEKEENKRRESLRNRLEKLKNLKK